MKYVVLMVVCIVGAFVSVYLDGLGAGYFALHTTGFVTGSLAMTLAGTLR